MSTVMNRSVSAPSMFGGTSPAMFGGTVDDLEFSIFDQYDPDLDEFLGENPGFEMLDTPKICALLNTPEEQYVEDCNEQPPDEFELDSGFQTMDDETIKALHDTIAKLEAEKKESGEIINKMKRKASDMEDENRMLLTAHDNLQETVTNLEEIVEEMETPVSTERKGCTKCHALQTPLLGEKEFNTIHFYCEDQYGTDPTMVTERYCQDCWNFNDARYRALEHFKAVNDEFYVKSEYSRVAMTIPSEKKELTYGDLDNIPTQKRRKVQLPVEKPGHNAVSCPFGCGWIKPASSGPYDNRPLKEHLANPKNMCISPDEKMVTRSTVAYNPVPKINCPIGTNGIETLIVCGFKQLKKAPNSDWVGDFLTYRCKAMHCGFKSYKRQRVEKHQRVCKTAV